MRRLIFKRRKNILSMNLLTHKRWPCLSVALNQAKLKPEVRDGMPRPFNSPVSEWDNRFCRLQDGPIFFVSQQFEFCKIIIDVKFLNESVTILLAYSCA